MRTVLLVGVVLVAMMQTAWAQTHPCDTINSTVYREPRSQLASLRLGWCFAPYDTEGVPIEEPVGFSLQINGGPDIDLGIVPALTGPNSQQCFYYEVPNGGGLAAGVLTLKAYTGSLGMSAQSDPITLTLTGSPRKPQNSTIVR